MPRKPSYDKNDLIRRAKDLFWKRGWAGTSMKDLEAELNLKPGSFYAAFGSKDALFELALERYAEDGTERLTNLADALGPLEALKRFPRYAVNTPEAPAKACMLAKTVLELHALEHPLASLADDKLTQMEAAFRALFQQAQEAGDIAADLDPAALGRRYQSDLMGLRLSAERTSVNASAIADEIAEGLNRLAG